jgi:hypothetical protein
MPSLTTSITTSSNRSLLRRCNNCKRLYVSCSGETLSCPSCRSQEGGIAVAISSTTMANNNNDEISVKHTMNPWNEVEYKHQSTETVIDLCCSEDDEDEEDVELVTSNISSSSDCITAAATPSAVIVSNDHSSNICQTTAASSYSLDVISSSSSSSCYKCVICGSSLQHISTLQGRVLHLKQCSKKYGIQARDVSRKDDDDDDDNEEEEQMDIATNTSTKIQQQQQVTNFFTNKQKSSSEPRTLNTILMDNARRLAKCNEIANKNNPLNKNNSNNKEILKRGTKSTWKRRPFQVSTYPVRFLEECVQVFFFFFF